MIQPAVNNLENEVVKYLMVGARCDVAYRNGSHAKNTFVIKEALLDSVIIRLFYQNNGTMIKEWSINLAAVSPVGGTFEWEILPTDLPTELKALNYWWEAYEGTTKEYLTYGTFSLNIG